MLDVLSYLGGIANRKQASDQFTASEAQNQSQFEASKAQSQAQFETQQKLERDGFNAKLQQFADQLGLSREQQAEKIQAALQTDGYFPRIGRGQVVAGWKTDRLPVCDWRSRRDMKARRA